MSAPIYAQTMNANISKLRAILAREPKTSEQLAELMALDINSVRILLHSQKEFIKQRVGKHDAWHWKGLEK